MKRKRKQIVYQDKRVFFAFSFHNFISFFIFYISEQILKF